MNYKISSQEEDNIVRSQAGQGESFASIVERRISRRGFLVGAAASASSLALAGCVVQMPQGTAGSKKDETPVMADGDGGDGSGGGSGLDFEPVSLNLDGEMTVPAGYQHQVLIAWGDPITADGPAFDPMNQTAEAQAQQFGYNCDFVGFSPMSMDEMGSDHGLLTVNHEYTSGGLMFPDYRVDDADPTEEHVNIEIAAHGVSVVEVARGDDGQWSVNLDSAMNRRFTGMTEMMLTGPVAGHDMLKTSADETGTLALGTFNNCAGGKTPWGTILTAEENFHQYFANNDTLADDDMRKSAHARYGVPGESSRRMWELYHSRFDVSQEPNEPFRFGWMVEIDPYDPSSTPLKRTALGRFRHEAATIHVADNGQVVAYSGDDSRFEYMYKFVSAGTYNADDRAANMGVLDEGTLYVAILADDGSGTWAPLVFGEGPLTEDNGFVSQADVLIRTREAADILGATKMDRPEDFEPNPVTGKVYVALTNNTRRGVDDNPGVDAANPIAENRYGHILEITEGDNDHTSTTFQWEIFMLCGDPEDESTYFAGYPKDQVSPIANPDNLTFDLNGNLWISTDGQPGRLNANDGLFAVPVEGEERGYLRLFLTGVTDCEICGPEFTPDNTSLFVAIQHPGDGDDSTFDNPSAAWPNGSIPARPAVVVVQAEDGRRIASAAA